MSASIRKILVLFFLLNFILAASAQQKYWVFFNEKKALTEFDPSSFFDQKAIERRTKNKISFNETDVPVTEGYLLQVTSLVDSVSAITRWFNAVSVYGKQEQIDKLRQLPFVREIQLIKSGEVSSSVLAGEDHAELAVRGEYQINVLGSKYIKEKNLDGTGIRIAVLDAGYSDANKNKAFEHLFKAGKIMKTFDFIRKSEHVYSYSDHGTMVLSCIAGIYENVQTGLATGAEFLLARTEHNYREPAYEEDKWIMAAEWADQNGADIISSSLGYTGKRYEKSELNGKSILSRAATFAARKGILVVNAAGNDGTEDWETLGVPADADSILTVGGTDPENGRHIEFSSYGPTADLRMKPNVCAPGDVTAAQNERLTRTQGTSFSTPLIAGFAACLMQFHKDWTNMQVLDAIERSGRLYPYFDYAHGYGIPTFRYFTDTVIAEPTFNIDLQQAAVLVRVNNDQIKGDESDVLYYHIRDEKDVIEKYFVLKVTSSDSFTLFYGNGRGKTLSIHYKGHTKEIRF